VRPKPKARVLDMKGLAQDVLVDEHSANAVRCVAGYAVLGFGDYV